jgi:hypothetical protein
MTGGKPEITWSKEATVETPDGKKYSAFMRTTWAVRGVWPDGTIKVRMLMPGEVHRHPEPDSEPEWASAIQADLEDQYEPVVVIGA